MGKPFINSSYNSSKIQQRERIILQKFSKEREYNLQYSLAQSDQSKQQKQKALTRKATLVNRTEIDLQNSSVNLGQLGLQQQDNAAQNSLKLTNQTWSTQQPELGQSTQGSNCLGFCAQNCGLHKQKSPSQNQSQTGSTLVKVNLLKFQLPEISIKSGQRSS